MQPTWSGYAFLLEFKQAPISWKVFLDPLLCTGFNLEYADLFQYFIECCDQRISTCNGWKSGWCSTSWMRSLSCGNGLVFQYISLKRVPAVQQVCLRKTYYHSCYTDSVQESKRFQCFVNLRQRRVTLFFYLKWNFWWNWREVVHGCWPKQCPFLCSIFRSFIGIWVKIWQQSCMFWYEFCAKQQI